MITTRLPLKAGAMYAYNKEIGANEKSMSLVNLMRLNENMIEIRLQKLFIFAFSSSMISFLFDNDNNNNVERLITVQLLPISKWKH